MTTLRTAAQQALEALDSDNPDIQLRAATALRAALAQEQADSEPACKCSLRTRLVGDGCEVCNPQMAAELRQEKEQPAPEPEHKPHCALLRIPSRECDCRGQPAPEPVATTQQPVEQTPPSDYRRGYWAGFEIGKREGRIEAEDALAQPAPVQRPMHPELRKMWEDYFDKCFRAMPAPPQRKPLSLTDLQEALVYTNLIDRDAIDNPEEYDDGSTLAQVDELHSIIKERV